MRKCLVAAAACLLTLLPVSGEPPASVAEDLQFTERTLAELQSLKGDLAGLQSRVDALIAALSERKGHLQNARPAPFGGVSSAASVSDRPDTKPPTVRCAALTKEGARCTRAALPGQRYCKQHALAKQK